MVNDELKTSGKDNLLTLKTRGRDYTAGDTPRYKPQEYRGKLSPAVDPLPEVSFISRNVRISRGERYESTPVLSSPVCR
jgi:hypothetical protein